MIGEKPDVVFSLVARQGNNAADLLAAAGSRGMEPNGWLNVAPTLLTEVLVADSIGGGGKEGEHPKRNNWREGIG